MKRNPFTFFLKLKINSLIFIFIVFRTGTSIGFKNIASKIAYDLRLWLDSKRTTQQPFPAQQSKSLDYDHQPAEPHNISNAGGAGGGAQVRPSASVGLTASVLAEQNEEDDEIYGEATNETTEEPHIKAPSTPITTTTTTTPSIPKTQCSKITTMIEAPLTTDSTSNPSPLPTELNVDPNTLTTPPPPSSSSTTNKEPIDPPDTNSSSNTTAPDEDPNKPESSNIQLGYNNMIASLLRTTTL